MYSKAIFTFFLAMALSLLAAAMPSDSLAARGGCLPVPTQTITVTAPPSSPTCSGGSSSCSTGPIQCCNSTMKVGDRL